MKKSKIIIVIVILFLVLLLNTNTVFALEESETVTKETIWIEENLIPVGMSVLGGLLTILAFLSKVKNSMQLFKDQATALRKENASKDKQVDKAISKFDNYFNAFVAAVNEINQLRDEVRTAQGKMDEARSETLEVRKENAEIREMIRLGFINNPDLVKTGVARLISEVGKKDED